MLFLFFLIFDLHFLIHSTIAQIFNPILELAIPKGILKKKAKAEIETRRVTVKAKIRKCAV